MARGIFAGSSKRKSQAKRLRPALAGMWSMVSSRSPSSAASSFFGGRMAVRILGPFLDALCLAGAAVKAGQDGTFIVGVDNVRIARVGDDVAAFAAADRVPVRAIDVPVIAAGTNTERRVVLLRSVNAILKIVVGGDMIKLRGGLVILGGPIFAAIH